MRIAVVGGGISGIYAAYKLASSHDVTLYEAASCLGGHADTHHLHVGGRTCSVDTGFIVFNEVHYPLFTSFLGELGVESQPSNMSFSVSNKNTGLEYNATDIRGLFCSRRNLVNPRFYRMLMDILRFYRRAPVELDSMSDKLTIGEYLEKGGYGQGLVQDHVIPMASALWSSPPTTVARFPARYFISFMRNHDMLKVADRPVWRTITGGSSKYVEAFQRVFDGRLLTCARVHEVTRSARGVDVRTTADVRRFDAVVLACHSDQSLAVLGDATDRERNLLAAIPYQQNDIALHGDTSLMPDRARAWASWNVVRPRGSPERYVVSYYMNMLQGLHPGSPLLVSLNASDLIDPDKMLLQRRYHHPVYTPESLRAQRELRQINGLNQTYFAGAYLGWGFHEDGVRSAREVVNALSENGMSRAA